MKNIGSTKWSALAIVIAGLLASTNPVLADPPSWAGGNKGKHDNKKDHERNGDDRDGRKENRREYFNTQHRVVIREYYDEQFRAGRCPPGLAKKHNGCMPPGQAKKWRVGQRLPRDVVYYDLPPAVVIRLGPPPSGHRYVRVATDILLIAIGTAMVVDAIDDLSRM
jgi:Ni/Co efflux regulator RcnB